MRRDDLSVSQACVDELAERLLEELGAEDDRGLEVAAMSALMAVGRSVMGKAFVRADRGEAFREREATWRPAVASNLLVMTMFGRVSVKRHLFRDRRNGPTRCLITEQHELVNGLWTPAAAKAGAMAISEMTLEGAESFFRDLGVINASRSSLLRLGGTLSDAWEADREVNERVVREATSIPAHAATAVLSLDGVMVMMTDSDRAARKATTRSRGRQDNSPAGWKEASVGVVSFYDKEGERLQTRRYGRMPESDKASTKAWLQAELAHIRTARPDLAIVAIADGAANNWTFLERLGADYEVVDFFHTVEHLHRHTSKAHGAATLKTQRLVQQHRHTLLSVPGAARDVFAELEAQQRRRRLKRSPKARGEQLTYFQRHTGRMDYATLRANRLPIGSGVTESTCKLTICDRLRRTGMRWSQRGGQAIITLRALRTSGQFEAGWDRMMDISRHRLAA